jgi:type IV pilus assembly protein PilX
VLAITLLILLVVTIVGVTTMGSSSVQLLLARNTQLKQISFQNAESTVLNGENAWDAAVSACLADLSSCTTDITPPLIDDPSTASMFDELDTFLSSSDPRVVDVSGYNGKYVVEYLGWRPVPGDDDKVVTHYRITGRALGPNGKALTRIQTIYRKCMKKDGSPCPT